MAFSRSGLYRVGGNGTGQTVWSYTSADAIATVAGADYFLEAINEMSVGDPVLVTDTATPALSLTFVKTNTGTAIDCASGTTVGDL